MLKTEIQAKKFSLSVTVSNDDKSAKRSHVGENLYTAAALIAHNNFKRKCCEFCNLKNHLSSKCLKITEPASRKKISRQKGSCFICFSKEHLASSCNCITSVENVMKNITSVSSRLNHQNETLLILPVKRILSKQRPIIFPTVKTLFYYTVLSTVLFGHSNKHI